MEVPKVQYLRDKNVHTIDFGIPAMPNIVIDYDKVPESERMGIAKALIAAATLACYNNTLSEALEARDANIEKLVAHTDIELGENEKFQRRIKAIKIQSRLEMKKGTESTFAKCKKIMNNTGCLITSSVHEGIDMSYDLESEFID